MNDDGGYEHKIKLNGVSGFVFSVRKDGSEITVSGWDIKHWSYKVGDRVVFVKNDGSETRYKIDSVEHCGDPNDQYFICCHFSPREGRRSCDAINADCKKCGQD